MSTDTDDATDTTTESEPDSLPKVLDLDDDDAVEAACREAADAARAAAEAEAAADKAAAAVTDLERKILDPELPEDGVSTAQYVKAEDASKFARLRAAAAQRRAAHQAEKARRHEVAAMRRRILAAAGQYDDAITEAELAFYDAAVAYARVCVENDREYDELVRDAQALAWASLSANPGAVLKDKQALTPDGAYSVTSPGTFTPNGGPVVKVDGVQPMGPSGIDGDRALGVVALAVGDAGVGRANTQRGARGSRAISEAASAAHERLAGHLQARSGEGA